MAEFVHVYNDGGGIRNVPMREGATRLTTDRVLYQSGIPFWIPPGDGGANGLTFTGTRGVFTLSAAAPMAGAYLLFVSGGYLYLPAGAGGLATDGWYWFVMTGETDGEIFVQKHDPASGIPKFISSPTAHPNLTSGRITQVTTEITACSFIIPGGSLGPNGIGQFLQKIISTSTAGTKSFRLTVGGQSWFRSGFTSSLNNQIIQVSRINMGVQNRQLGNKTNTTGSAWDCGSSATTIGGDVTTVDTSIDQTATVTVQLATTNTDSVIVVPLLFIAKYGG